MRSCMTRSALARASLSAATIKSSRISFSSGFMSDGSRDTLLACPFAVVTTLTAPPPATPSTSIRSSSAWASASFCCMAWACFMMPIRSRIPHLSSWILVPLRTVRGVAPAHKLRLGIRRRRALLAHVHDLGTREAVQHGADQRMADGIVRPLPLGVPALLVEGRRAGFRRGRHHPAAARPVMEEPTQVVQDRAAGAGREIELDPAVLEGDEPGVALQRNLQADLTPLPAQSYHVLEATEARAGGFRLRARRLRARPRGSEGRRAGRLPR